MAYSYDRRFASMQPTVSGFLAILRANLIQADAEQQKRDLKRKMTPNIYALGLMLETAEKVEKAMGSSLKSSEPEDLETLKKNIKRFFNDVAPIKKTVKTIEKFLSDGKPPKYPTGGAQPIWK